jgi:hypothetical protein
MEMHLERGTRMGADEQNNLAGNGIKLDQLDEMSLGPGNPGQIRGIGMTSERLMYGMSAGGVAHD